jgi:hypothetical protein
VRRLLRNRGELVGDGQALVPPAGHVGHHHPQMPQLSGIERPTRAPPSVRPLSHVDSGELHHDPFVVTLVNEHGATRTLHVIADRNESAGLGGAPPLPISRMSSTSHYGLSVQSAAAGRWMPGRTMPRRRYEVARFRAGPVDREPGLSGWIRLSFQVRASDSTGWQRRSSVRWVLEVIGARVQMA